MYAKVREAWHQCFCATETLLPRAYPSPARLLLLLHATVGVPARLFHGVAIFRRSFNCWLGGVSSDLESIGVLLASQSRRASLRGLVGRLDAIAGDQANWRRKTKTARTSSGTRGKKAGATSGPIILFFAKELWKIVGDDLFLALPFLFVSWQTPCVAKKIQNR